MMGTTLREVLDVTMALIPKDYKSELLDDLDLAQKGVMDMAVAMGVPLSFVSDTDGRTSGIDRDLTMATLSLSSYFTYRAYLLRLKDELNRDAINFKTLTFEIKGLEKRPEAINDTLYQVNRYLKDEIDRVNGASSVLGIVSSYGGTLDG